MFLHSGHELMIMYSLLEMANKNESVGDSYLNPSVSLEE